MIYVGRRIRRDILRAFRWWRGFLHVGASAGVFRRQALFQGLMVRCRHIGSGTSRQQSEAEQAGSDLDFHSLDLVNGKRRCFIITIINRRMASTFLATKSVPESALAVQLLPAAKACVRSPKRSPTLNVPANSPHPAVAG